MAGLSVMLWFQLVLTIPLLPEGRSEKTELKILGLLPYYQGATGWSSGYLLNPAPAIAVDDVNNNDTILANYKLTMIVKNGGCEDAAAVASSVGEALLTENIVGIIGAPCSFSSIIMSNIANNAGINQISYGSELADVSDTYLYPYFFRTTINLAHAADGFARLLAPGALNRSSIVVIAQQIKTWQEVALFFEVRFRFYKRGNTVAHQSLLSGNDDDSSMDSKLKVIERFNRHVIVTFLPPDIATRLMCRAYRLGMTYPNYLWIHHLTTGEWEWWKNNAYFQGCSSEEMQLAHNGSLIHRLQLNATNETRYGKYIDEYKLRLEQYLTDLNVPFNPPDSNCSDASLPCVSSIVHGLYSRTAYDAVWVLATALDRAEKILTDTDGFNLTGFQRGINNFSKAIHHSLGETNLDGLSGEIRYRSDDTKTLAKNTRTIQSAFYLILMSASKIVATYDGNDSSVNSSDVVLQLRLEVTPDVDVLPVYRLLFSSETGAFSMAINIVCLISTTVLLILNNMYFQHQPFKGSDATLTNFQIGFVYLLTLGSLISSVFGSFHIDNSIAFGVAANCSVWFAEVGLVAFLALAVAKSYRLYRLFIHFSEDHHYLNVKYLLVYILISLGVITLIEFICVIVTPYIRSLDQFTKVEDHLKFFYTNDNIPHFVTVLFLILFLLVFLFVLGIQSWMIRDPRFYDIHYHAMLSVLILLYCLVAISTLLTVPHLYWPFMHSVSYVYCGLAIQVFFVLTFFWKFYRFHHEKATIKCHCMPKASESKDSHHSPPVTKSPIVYRRRASSRIRNADYKKVF